jgi:hypothetical protein
LRLGNLILKDTPDRTKGFTKFLSEAKRFPSFEEAWEFAFAERQPNGDTSAQRVTKEGRGVLKTTGQSAHMTIFLKQEFTSVLENNRLWGQQMLKLR